jgi:hypothetical protein
MKIRLLSAWIELREVVQYIVYSEELSGATAYIERNQHDHVDEIERQAIKIIVSLEGRQAVCLDKQRLQ